MEQIILNVLEFTIAVPTSIYFLRFYSRAGESDKSMYILSTYLLELTLLEYSMLRYLPSMVAAAAVLLTRVMHKKTPIWVHIHVLLFLLQKIIVTYRLRCWKITQTTKKKNFENVYKK